MTEIQQKHCKVCGELKARIAAGVFQKRKGKRWVDDSGKLWNGLVCPDCHARRAAVNMRRLRSQPREKHTDEPTS